MIRDFAGKTAVVTGAARGIGYAIAEQLVQRGATVALLDRDEGVMRVAEELGGTAHLIDVSSNDDWARVREEVLAAHREVHLLVSNAGVSVAGSFEEVSQEDFEWLFGVNFWGAVHGCRALLPTLRAQTEAHIVLVCSSFAWLGVPGKSAYASSKAALRALGESLRAELRDTSVGVTTLFPGPVATALVRDGRAVSAAQRDAEAAFLARRAIAPRRVAMRCLDGVRRDRARVVVGVDYRALELAVRLAPQLTHAVVARMSKRLPF